ncbi:MAG: SMC-Scp complex subunit ScpB [Bacteroidetes bacterium]|nr:SMC-Scp complex subunit ScpB [Bacteroidota bacterium]
MDKIYKSIIEALIFSSDDVVSSKELIKAIKGIDGDDIQIKDEDIGKSVESLNDNYVEENKAFEIKKIAEGYIFATKEEYANYIGYLTLEKSKRRLSQAALETLSIIAYKQPITKPELESIRGVNCDYMLSTLLDKKLVSISGRSDTVGRPLLYKTTSEFLKYFALNNLKDLPKPREIEEIMQDEDFLDQKRKIMMNAIEEEVEKEIQEENGNGDTTE